MSRSKTGQRPQRSRPSRAEKSTAPAKKHLSPLTTALIVIPFCALAAYLSWLVLGQGDGSGTAQLDQFAAADNQTRSVSSADSGWNATVQGNPWDTEGSQIQNWSQFDDASSDGWDTEVLSDKVTKQLDKFKKLMASTHEIDSAAVAHLAADDVDVTQLRPDSLQTAFSDKDLRVQRADLEVHPVGNAGRGPAALAQVLTQLTTPYTDRQQLRLKLKVFRVEKREGGITTHQTLEAFGPTADGVLEENAVWIADWRPGNDGDTPILSRLEVTQYESVERAGGILFSDCTESALGGNESFRQQLLKGYNFWLERSQFNRFFSILGNPGIAVGDVNSDGLDDLYVCQEAGLPNLLYLQNPDGTLRDVSRQSGVDWLQNSSTALIVDLNNDGHKDLAVGVTGGIVISRGDSSGRFVLQQVLDTSDHVLVVNAADYDRDGRLDLYAGAYFPDGVPGETEDVIVVDSGKPFINGGSNSLFRNECDRDQWAFRDVTQECGLNVNNNRYTLASAWEDYDNDGDQDLYVANDYGWNNLYRNDAGADGARHFVDIAVEAGAKDNAFGMSANWGDYDRDGWMDLYISNMFSYAGNRITFQQQFKAGDSDDVKQRFQRYARGNTLLRNLGSGAPGDGTEFEDLSVAAGVNRGRWAWGSSFVDLNNDGWEDVVCANGYITTDDTGDL